MQHRKTNNLPGVKVVLFKPFGQDVASDFYAINNYRNFLFDNANDLQMTKEEYYSIIDKLAELGGKKTRLENPNINSVLIDNAEKLYKWQEIFSLQNRFKVDKVNVHRFHDENVFNKTVEEFRTFYESASGKKVLIGCPSRMEYALSTLEILEDPRVYENVDCIILGHGKGSSLITDIKNPNTWRFSDNDKSIYEFLEENIPGKKALVTSCETNGLELVGLKDTPVDNSGQIMYGIGKHVMAGFPEKQPLKYVEAGIRHIKGHSFVVKDGQSHGSICLGDGDALTTGSKFKIVPYILDFSKYKVT